MARDTIQGERRRQQRYPIELELEYRIIEQGKVIASGEGRTGNISSGGLLFRPNSSANGGQMVELSIRWPAILGNAPFVMLFVTGRIMRNDVNGVAVRSRRYEFQKLGNVRAAFDELFGKYLVQ